MRKYILSFAILLAMCVTTSAQWHTVENPSFEVRNGSIYTPTKIEMYDDCTRVYCHVVFRPGWWVSFDKESLTIDYLQDVESGNKYSLTDIEGMVLGERFTMPVSGEHNIVKIYKPLPKEVRKVNMLYNKDNNESSYWGIDLYPDNTKKDNRKELMSSVKGNWLTTDGHNNWEYGIYDSLVITNQQWWHITNIYKKGKNILLDLQNENNGSKTRLKATLQKDGKMAISMNNHKGVYSLTPTAPYLYTPSANKHEETAEVFFKRDTTYLQGYIEGYAPQLGFKTGIIYAGNGITCEDNPAIVHIHPDGRFEAKFVIPHPQKTFLNITNVLYCPLYSQPGDTLTYYINWEELLVRNRLRQRDYPLHKQLFMGSTASTNHLYRLLDKFFVYDYQKLRKEQKELTPGEFMQQLEPIFSQWNTQTDSIIATYLFSPKEEQIIRTHMALKKGETLLNFLNSRRYYSDQDTTNQALKAKAEDNYYSFLHDNIYNSNAIMAAIPAGSFINRLEFAPALYEELHSSYTNDRTLQHSLTFYRKQREKLMLLTQSDTNPLLCQWIQARNYSSYLSKELSRQNAAIMLDTLCAYIPDPILQSEMQRMYEKHYPAETNQSGYELPQTESADIFRQLIAPYKGKTLFVDFWATFCAPCIQGIKNTADLRKAYHNNDKFNFIYITNSEDSPENNYNKFVAEHLVGEASYRIPDDNYLHLRELFGFNGIPRYVLISPEGRILNENYNIHDLRTYLDENFKDK